MFIKIFPVILIRPLTFIFRRGDITRKLKYSVYVFSVTEDTYLGGFGYKICDIPNVVIRDNVVILPNCFD